MRRGLGCLRAGDIKSFNKSIGKRQITHRKMGNGSKQALRRWTINQHKVQKLSGKWQIKMTRHFLQIRMAKVKKRILTLSYETECVGKRPSGSLLLLGI